MDENSQKTLHRLQESIDSSIYFVKQQDENYLTLVRKENKYMYHQFILWALMEQNGLCQHYKTIYKKNILSILNKSPQGLNCIPSIQNYAQYGTLCRPFELEAENSDEESWYATTESE